MTMKSKKKVIAFAAVLPLLAVLAGCSNSGGTAKEAPVTKDMKATLNVWTYEPQTAGTATDATTQVAAFKKLYPNVNVKITFIPEAQFATKVIASGTTKSGPDVLWINGAYTQQYAQAGVLENMDSDWKSYSDASKYPASVIGSYDKKMYSIQSYVNLNGLWYNKTILDQYGLDVPKTLAEMQSDMKTITASKKYQGLQIAGTTGVEGEWISKAFFTGYGVDSFKNYGDSKTQKMFDLVSNWVDKGYISKGNVGLSQTDGVNKFLEGKTAFYVGGNWQLGMAKDVPFTVGVASMPAGPDGASHVYLGGQAESIGAFSKNKALAWKYIQQTWLSSSFSSYALGKGSIPSRSDGIPADVDSNVKAYAEELKSGVALSPDTKSTLAVGNLWSGVLAGQSSPSQGLAIAKQIAAGAK